jgi:hypothetical protein
MESIDLVKREMSINQRLLENALTELTWQVSTTQQKMESSSLKGKLS